MSTQKQSVKPARKILAGLAFIAGSVLLMLGATLLGASTTGTETYHLAWGCGLMVVGGAGAIGGYLLSRAG